MTGVQTCALPIYIIDTPQFQVFPKYYNETAQALNDKDTIQSLYGMDDAFWQEVRLKFLYLPESGPS